MQPPSLPCYLRWIIQAAPVERRFTLPDQIVFLAFQNEQLAGLCHIQGVRLIASDGYAEISALVVNTALQRSGIGKALVSHAKKLGPMRPLT